MGGVTIFLGKIFEDFEWLKWRVSLKDVAVFFFQKPV